MGKALDAWREQTGKTKPQGMKTPASTAEAEQIAMRNYGAATNPILSALSISPAPVSVKPVYDKSADRRREEDKPQNRTDPTPIMPNLVTGRAAPTLAAERGVTAPAEEETGVPYQSGGGNARALAALDGIQSRKTEIETANPWDISATSSLLASGGRYTGNTDDFSDIDSRLRTMARSGKVDNREISAIQKEIFSRMGEPGTQTHTLAQQYLDVADILSNTGTALGHAVYTGGQIAAGAIDTSGAFASGAKTMLGDLLTKGSYSDGYQKIESYLADRPQLQAQIVGAPNRAVLIANIANDLGLTTDVVNGYIGANIDNMTAAANDRFADDVGPGYKKWVGKGAYILGQQLPGMGISAGMSAAGGGGGLIGNLMNKQGLKAAASSALKGNISTYIMGSAAASNAYNELAKENGYDPLNYVNAVGQGFIEYFTEGLFGISDADSVARIFSANGSGATSVLRGVFNWLASGLEEGLEEVVNIPLSGVLDKITIEPGKKWFGTGGIIDPKAMMEDGVAGTIMGLVLGGTGGLAAIQTNLRESGDIRTAVTATTNVNRMLPEEYRVPEINPNTATMETAETYTAQVAQAYGDYAQGAISPSNGTANQQATVTGETTDSRPGAPGSVRASNGDYLREEHHGNVLDGMREHVAELESMPSVSNISGTEFQKSNADNRNLRTRIIEFFNSLGNKVTRSDIGDIALNSAGVHDSLGHGYGKLKAATFAALPDVLTRGKILSVDPNYKNRGYESYLIAAPVNVGDMPCYVGAYVIKDPNTQRYKVHEVLAINKEGTQSFKTGALTEGGSRDGAPSDNSIPRNEQAVNRSVGAAQWNMTPYTTLQNQYGIMPEGENPARVAPVPNRGGDGRNVMQTARTVVEAEATPDARVEQIEQLVTQGKLGYDSVANPQLVDEAVAQLQENGWRDSVREWTRAVDQGKVSDKLVAMGAVILNNAGNSDVSAAEYADLVVDYATLLDNASKGLQAARILKRLSPEWKLYGIQKSINRLAQEYAGKYKFTLSDSLIAEYRAAKTDAERDAVIGKMQKYVADQVPSSAADKFVALRYVNMLGNFKTQARNVLSNAAMLAVASTKRRVEGALQAAWNAVANKHGVRRTSALAPGKARRDAARADFDKFKLTVMGQNKYSDNGSPSSLLDIERNRTIFKNNGTWGTTESSPLIVRAARKATDLGYKALEAYRKVTNWAIEEGDAIFSKANYVDALSGWMKANGITAEQWNSGQVDSKTMDEARAFAIKEAQEATFRDSNDFANWVSRVGRRKDTPKAARLIGEGTLPFRKTLANVAVRFEEYSPLGLLNTAVDAARAQKQDSDVTGNDVINSLSKSLVGSAIFGLGWILAKKGLLSGGDDDDNMQDYSLVIPGKGEFSLSWLSPTAVPLFMGAQLYNMTQDDELSWADIDEVIAEAIDPIMEMSIASGVRDALDDARYAENNLAHTLIKGALSYLLQGLTNTGLGQIERTFEQYRQTTTPDKDSNIPAWLQREVGQASAKTPGVDLYQADYIDEWGRKQDNGGWLARAANNILNPGNVSKAEQDPIILEAIELYNKGYRSALPSKPASSFSYVDKADKTEATINLDAQEYQAFLENVGGIRHDMAQEMMDSYGDLPDGIKEEILKDAYSYALAEGKAGVSSYERDGQDALLHELGTEDGVTYLAYKAAFEAALEGDAESYLDMVGSFDEQSDAVQEALNKVSLFKTTYAAIEAGYDLDKIEEAREIIGSVNGKDENGESVSGLKKSRAWEKADAAGFSKYDFNQLYKILG